MGNMGDMGDMGDMRDMGDMGDMGDIPLFYLVPVVLPDFVFLLLKATLNIREYHPVDNLRLFYFIFYMSFLFHTITIEMKKTGRTLHLRKKM